MAHSNMRFDEQKVVDVVFVVAVVVADAVKNMLYILKIKMKMMSKVLVCVVWRYEKHVWIEKKLPFAINESTLSYQQPMYRRCNVHDGWWHWWG